MRVMYTAQAHLLPQALADGVARRLPGPAEVAVELEAQEPFAHRHVLAQEGPGGPVVPAALAHPGQTRQLSRALLAQVHADVEHHARRAQPLGVKHAHPVARVVLEAEVRHELLGVQRPALAVAGDPAAQTPPGVELVAHVGLHPHLQVVARHALVEDGGALLPGGEGVSALGHGPPHPARPAEVIRGSGVVDAARGRGGDHAFQRPERGRDVKVRAVQCSDRRVRGLLHPLLKGLRAVDGTGRVLVQPVQGLTYARARPIEPARDLPLLGVDRRQALAAPLVGLVQVDDGAQELPAEAGVTLAPHAVGLARARLDLSLQHPGHVLVALARCRGSLLQVSLEGLRQLGAVGEPGLADESRVRARGRPGLVPGLLDAGAHLAAGRDVPARGGQAQRGGVLT